MSSNYPPGCTQYDHDQAFMDDDRPSVDCLQCGKDLLDSDKRLEHQIGRHEFAFCNPTCRLRYAYLHTLTASGRGAILRFIAALHILSEADMLSQAPLIAALDIGGDQGAQVGALREAAMGLLDEFNEDGSNDFACLAVGSAETLITSLGWQVTFPESKKGASPAVPQVSSERHAKEVQ